MKFSLKFSVKIERSDALERALEDLQVGTDNQSRIDEVTDEADDDQVVGYGFGFTSKRVPK